MTDLDRIPALIDISFYTQEAGVAFSSADEAGRHFLAVGQKEGLSPSPFVLWGVIRAENPGLTDVRAFLADPLRACAHPAFAPELHIELCRSVAGDLARLTILLSRAAIDRGPLLPRFAEAGRALGHRDLLPFMATLTAQRLADPKLEMGVFSSAWYRDAYEDVDLASLNPFRHYVVSGWREGRDPSPAFSTAAYLERHPDIRRAGANPLIHFLGAGEREGRAIDRSTAYFPLVRHQTRRGRLPAQYVPFAGGDDAAIEGIRAEFAEARLVIVVPFFRNEGLVAQVCGSLLTCAAELREHRAGVILVDDSPGYAPLRDALQTWADRLSVGGIDVVLFEAQRNLGFVHATNIGLRCAELLSCACLMLNSDAQLHPGSLSEMLHVASLDDRFAFVNPLSNNATLATLGLDATPDAGSAARHHAAVATALPRYLIVPTCVGFCLLVKREVIRLFGYLDPVYGKGYNEENDYIMRANRKGYISVLAPRAFVAHVGEQSFSAMPLDKNAREEKNKAILLQRYPEFEAAVDGYFASPDAQARRAVERYGQAIDVVIDASTLPGIANGTSVLARELIPRLVRRLGVERCAVQVSAEHLGWLGLADLPGLVHWHPSDANYAKVAVRLSQPFARKDVEALSSHAVKLVFFMLDTISDDCLYLRDAAAHDLWEWVSEFSDALVYNSPYSMEKYQRRFDVASRVIQRASYHSLSTEDYSARYRAIEDDHSLSAVPFILVVGNYYQHKAIGMALDATDDLALPRVLIGAKVQRPNLTSFESGRLSQDEVTLLYKKAALILFPSLYEGFGFPMMEGVASGNPVVVHANALTRDMARRMGVPPTVLMFDAFSDLPNVVSRALSLGRERRGRPKGAQEDGWDRSVDEIVDVLKAVHERDFSYAHVVRRQKALRRLP